MLTIPARMLNMSGTQIEREGMVAVRANRKANMAMNLPAMDKHGGDRSLKSEPIAIVGFGPSLKHTWERLREFKVIWTVSMAHDFLLNRGITPTYHLDLDPRAHKAEFLMRPQTGTTYFLSSHVHPDYTGKLKNAGVDVRLYHVAIDPHEKLDPRYPSLKVRFDAGVQAAEAAFQFGYREQHWFGIEYGHEGDMSHAGPHWGVKADKCQVVMDNGRTFISDNLFFHGLMLAEKFLCDRVLVKCTIHGDGLLPNFMECRGKAKFKHLI